MKTKYTLFRRGGIYYSQDSATGQQKSLRTRDEAEALKLINARNEAHRQPVLNLHLARAYLTRQRPRLCGTHLADRHGAVAEPRQGEQPRALRQRVQVARPLTDCGTRNLWKPPPMISLPCSKKAKCAINCFLKRLHNFALSLGWIAIPIVAPVSLAQIRTQRPARHHAGRTPKHFGQGEKQPNGNCIWNCFGKRAQRRATPPNFNAEDIDWQTRTISYFRKKTGSLAQFTISTALEKVLHQLPTTGALFPKLSHLYGQRPRQPVSPPLPRAGVSGVTLHCYRYAWAERAKMVGMPERFAQAALGHNSKAIHRAYAKKAVIIAPSLEDYERKAASLAASGGGLKIKRRLSLAHSTAFCLFWGLPPSPNPAPEALSLDSVIRSRWP